MQEYARTIFVTNLEPHRFVNTIKKIQKYNKRKIK